MDRSAPDRETRHATAIALDGRALLIAGASGSGKSTLALQLMACGARLVSDDRTDLHRNGDTVIASAPDAIRGLIEARGIGLLQADPAPPTALTAVLDLDTAEPDRLPPLRHVTVLGCPLPLFLRPQGIHVAPALLQFLRAGRSER